MPQLDDGTFYLEWPQLDRSPGLMALYPINQTRRYTCRDYRPDVRYHCSRAEGHDGPHVGHDGAGTIVAIWEMSEDDLSFVIAVARLDGAYH